MMATITMNSFSLARYSKKNMEEAEPVDSTHSNSTYTKLLTYKPQPDFLHRDEDQAVNFQCDKKVQCIAARCMFLVVSRGPANPSTRAPSKR
jgi:hypothetical protein